MPPSNTTAFDVVIIGAGPAGTGCALALKDAGLRVALLEKDGCLRDKTCGDAVPGPCLAMLTRMVPDARNALERLVPKQRVTASDLYAPSGRHLRISWRNEAYNIPRGTFDRFLRDLVRQHTRTDLLENARVTEITPAHNGVRCACADGRTITAAVVVGCDGARPAAARLCGTAPDPYAHTYAGRTYLELPDRTDTVNRFFLFRSHPAAYAWLFPVGNGRFNAGIGIINRSGRRTPIKPLFNGLITTDPVLKEFFKDARTMTPFTGHLLPIWHPARRYAGPRCLLCGDAAGLVDPLQGHGMHTAMRSGMLAGQVLARAFGPDGFDAAAPARYGTALRRGVLPELRRNYLLMRIMRRIPRLPELVINTGGAVPWGRVVSRLM